MVCCALISLVLACLFFPARILLRRFRPQVQPLNWQLSTVETPEQSAFKLNDEFSLAARVKSFSFAFSGLKQVVRNEHNAWIHLSVTAAVVLAALLLRFDAGDWLVLIIAIMSVWFAETINTAFEHLCDVVSPEKNDSVRQAKDIAAGAVLIIAMGAALMGVITFAPYLHNMA